MNAAKSSCGTVLQVRNAATLCTDRSAACTRYLCGCIRTVQKHSLRSVELCAAFSPDGNILCFAGCGGTKRFRSRGGGRGGDCPHVPSGYKHCIIQQLAHAVLLLQTSSTFSIETTVAYLPCLLPHHSAQCGFLPPSYHSWGLNSWARCLFSPFRFSLGPTGRT